MMTMASLMVMRMVGVEGPAGVAGGALVVMLAWCWSFCRDLGDGGPGAGFVDDGLVGGVGGDEGLDGQVVHGPGQSAG